jgi:hypothetical protein
MSDLLTSALFLVPTALHLSGSILERRHVQRPLGEQKLMFLSSCPNVRLVQFEHVYVTFMARIEVL